MASYTDYFDGTTGSTYYAKERPLDTGTWGNGVVSYSENGSTGEFSATLDGAKKYVVFLQAGGSPASSDTKFANVSFDLYGATYDDDTDSLEAISNATATGTNPQLLQSTTIATLASQTTFTLTAGSSDDDAYNGATVVVTDSATSTQKAVATVEDYTGSTETITLRYDPGVFTMAAGDSIVVLATVNGAPGGNGAGPGWIG